jgi:hypothetical protein
MTWGLLKVKWFKEGHSFEELENLTLEEIGLITAYEVETAKASETKEGINKRLSS